MRSLLPRSPLPRRPLPRAPLPAFPGFHRLHSLSNAGDEGFTALHGRPRDARALLRGELLVAPSAPVAVAWAAGPAVPGDVIWTATWCGVVVGARVLDVLRRRGITGWSTYPVRVSGPSGDAIPGYAGLSITGRCGPVDLGRSALVLRSRPGGRLPFHHGRYFDEATWDGSDLFMERDGPDGATGWVHATERVRDALAAAGVAGVRFTPLTEWEGASEAHAELWPPVVAARLARLRAAARHPA